MKHSIMVVMNLFLGNQFIIKTIGSKIQIQAPRIKCIDREYVKNISGRA